MLTATAIRKQTWMYLAIPITLYACERLTRALRSSIKHVIIQKAAPRNSGSNGFSANKHNAEAQMILLTHQGQPHPMISIRFLRTFVPHLEKEISTQLCTLYDKLKG